MKLGLTYEFFQLRSGEYSYQGIALPLEDSLFKKPYFKRCFFKLSFKDINEGKRINDFVKEKILQLNKRELQPSNLEKEFSNKRADFVRYTAKNLSEKCLFCGSNYDFLAIPFMVRKIVEYTKRG